MKTLILTEKPSIARDFAKALGVNTRKEGFLEGSGYVITWTIGHLLELAEPADYDDKWRSWSLHSLPILPGALKYKPIPNTEKQLRVVQRQVSRDDTAKVIVATDAGREGEVIARTVLQTVALIDKSIWRFWTSQALTPQVIKETLQNLKPATDYDRLWQAGQARQVADWLVGMNLSRAATLRIGGKKDVFSVGRVQTAVLALLVDRLRERENFIAEPYWILRANFSTTAHGGGKWSGTWFKGKQNRFESSQEAEKVLHRIDGQTGRVKSVKRENKKQAPPLLYSLTDLQRDANAKFGLSAKQTLDIAQQLYETKKCLSYPRTDARVLGSKNVDLVHKIIARLAKAYAQIFQGLDQKLCSASNKRVFNDAQLTDHHALIPLAVLPERATRDEYLIYQLVLKRFAAAFYPDYQYESIEVVTEVRKETFRTRGIRPIVQGWKAVYELTDDQGGKSAEEGVAEDLPPLEKDDPAQVEEASIDEKMTQPPAEYTEALLLKDMTNPSRYVSEDQLKKIFRGDVGLGTQATRAQIIETLLTRSYVVREEKKLTATAKGCLLIDNLRGLSVSSAIATPEETARWEMELEKIAQGKGDSEGFMAAVKKFVTDGVEEFKMNETQPTTSQPLGKCPTCGGNIIEGKKGYGCSNWRQQDGGCRFVVWKEMAGQKISIETCKQLLAGETSAPMNFRARDGREFSSGLKLEQDGAEGRWQVRFVGGGQPAPSSEQAPGGEAGEQSLLGRCPVCGGEVIEGGKAFGCKNWRQEDGGCRFVIWKQIAGRQINTEDVRTLLEHGITGVIDNFISKKGNPFSAKLKLDENFKAVFVFGPFSGD